jgi:hypothetical protein
MLYEKRAALRAVAATETKLVWQTKADTSAPQAFPMVSLRIHKFPIFDAPDAAREKKDSDSVQVKLLKVTLTHCYWMLAKLPNLRRFSPRIA